VLNIKAMLNCFELALGLKVNFFISSIVEVGVDAFSIQGFTTIPNCEVMKVPSKYLGLPIRDCHKREVFWDGVVARIKYRLGR